MPPKSNRQKRKSGDATSGAEAWGAALDDPLGPPLPEGLFLVPQARPEVMIGPIGEGPVRVYHEESVPYVLLGRLILPSRFQVHVDDERLPAACLIEVELYPGGRFQIDRVSFWRRLGDVDITGETVRRVPLRSLVREALGIAAFSVHRAAGGEVVVDRPGVAPRLRRLVRHLVEDEIRKKTGPRRRRRQHGDEHYRKVAEVYREARARGRRDPTNAVYEWATKAKVNCARSTAGRWVMEARERGFLGKARPGAAGEQEGADDG